MAVGRGGMGKLVGGFVVFGQQRAQPFQATGDDLKHGGGSIRRQFLRQRGDAQPGLPPDVAAIGVHFASQQAQQRGFAGAVAANQADPFARIELETGAVQQLFSAEGDREMINA
jgi:hypothetical protein